jgi:hypothetical protein
MPLDIVQTTESSHAWGSLNALVGSDGTPSHPLAKRLATTLMPLRDLADAIHFLCMLHGRHPSLIDLSAAHSTNNAAHEWAIVAAESFAEERAYLVRLVAAAGPLPSTPGQAECDIAVEGQRHALDMLARSDRNGCAAGAAIALALDWHAIRAILDVAAERLGIVVGPSRLPPIAETATIVAALAQESALERAMMFGARQLLAQHRGLWDLLEARASARAIA